MGLLSDCRASCADDGRGCGDGDEFGADVAVATLSTAASTLGALRGELLRATDVDGAFSAVVVVGDGEGDGVLARATTGAGDGDVRLAAAVGSARLAAV